jgi:hypothetical protein
MHVPGHLPRSLVYVTVSQGKKIIFGQDVHGPLDASLLPNREDYLKLSHSSFFCTLRQTSWAKGIIGFSGARKKWRTSSSPFSRRVEGQR